MMYKVRKTAAHQESWLELELEVCPRCGTAMEDRQCKIVCGGCGYFRDCED